MNECKSLSLRIVNEDNLICQIQNKNVIETNRRNENDDIRRKKITCDSALEIRAKVLKFCVVWLEALCV